LDLGQAVEAVVAVDGRAGGVGHCGAVAHFVVVKGDVRVRGRIIYLGQTEVNRLAES
jgi:hypothetical protein